MASASSVVSIARTIPTFAVSPWWMVKGQAQRDDGSNFQDYKGDVLQSLPHQLQECLGLLGGNEVLAEHCVTVLQIKGVTRQTCRHEHENLTFTSIKKTSLKPEITGQLVYSISKR